MLDFYKSNATLFDCIVGMEQFRAEYSKFTLSSKKTYIFRRLGLIKKDG